RLQFQSGIEMLLRVRKIAHIDHRHRIVVVFFGGLEIDYWLFEPAIAHADVELGVMRHFAVWPAAGLDEQFPGFGKFSRMEKANSLLKRLQLSLRRGTRLRGGRRYSGILTRSRRPAA